MHRSSSAPTQRDAAATPELAERGVSLPWAFLAAGWTLLVWGLLTTPAPPQVPSGWLPAAVQPWQDKIGHAGLFFVQAGLVQRALRARLGAGRAFVVGAALALLLGGVTEIRQRWVANREADVLDFAADAGGALLYGALLFVGRSLPGAADSATADAAADEPRPTTVVGS
jgi:VanZ family protein